MYVCERVCVCMCMCVCICIYMYVSVCVHMCVCVCLCICERVCVCVHVYVCCVYGECVCVFMCLFGVGGQETGCQGEKTLVGVTAAANIYGIAALLSQNLSLPNLIFFLEICLCNQITQDKNAWGLIELERSDQLIGP